MLRACCAFSPARPQLGGFGLKCLFCYRLLLPQHERRKLASCHGPSRLKAGPTGLDMSNACSANLHFMTALPVVC